MRDSPPDEARAWAGPQASSSSTLRPSLSRCHAVQAPKTPAPMTITSRRLDCTPGPSCSPRSAASDFTVVAPAAAAMPVSSVRREKGTELGILSFSLVPQSFSGTARRVNVMTNLSYVSGVSSEPLLYKTVGAVLEEAAARWGQREALVVRHQNIRWTYRELDQAADRLAAGLIHLGLVPGDRIGIWAPNRYEWIVTQFATAKAGLILVTINPAYRTSELEYALNKVGCKALVLAPSFKTSDYAAMFEQIRPKVPTLRAAILTDDAPCTGFLRYADVASSGTADDLARVRQLRPQLQPEDAVNIQFTSGTTGLPKGATLSHHNIVNNGYFVAQRMTFSERDSLCIPVPLYHCFGMVMGVLGCVTWGATMVFPGEAFEPKGVLEAVQAERCTALYGVPTMFIAELEHPEFRQYDLRTLRTGVMAGAPGPGEK